jgi:hypothetical protein
LPFVFASHEGWRTDPAKPGMIRFVRIAIFSEVQKPFFIRKAADSIVKIRTIRFVGWPFVFGSPEGWRGDVSTQFPNVKGQMTNKVQTTNEDRG